MIASSLPDFTPAAPGPTTFRSVHFFEDDEAEEGEDEDEGDEEDEEGEPDEDDLYARWGTLA